MKKNLLYGLIALTTLSTQADQDNPNQKNSLCTYVKNHPYSTITTLLAVITAGYYLTKRTPKPAPTPEKPAPENSSAPLPAYEEEGGIYQRLNNIVFHNNLEPNEDPCVIADVILKNVSNEIAGFKDYIKVEFLNHLIEKMGICARHNISGGYDPVSDALTEKLKAETLYLTIKNIAFAKNEFKDQETIGNQKVRDMGKLLDDNNYTVCDQKKVIDRLLGDLNSLIQHSPQDDGTYATLIDKLNAVKSTL